jgi:hypothetical protein
MTTTATIRLRQVERCYGGIQGVDDDGNRWHRMWTYLRTQACSFCGADLFGQYRAFYSMEKADDREVCEAHIELEGDDESTGS